MEKKMTYAQALDVAIEKVGEGEVAEKLTALKEKLANANATRTKKVSTAQEETKALVLNALEVAGKPATVTELLATGVFPVGTSSQKVTAMLGKLVTDGKAVKTVDKKKSYFGLAE
jgi:predicted deacylase